MNETTVVSENIKLTLYSTSLISIPCNNLTAFSLESRVTSHVPLSTLSTTARTVFRPVIASVSYCDEHLSFYEQHIIAVV
jgi:hypothetical protein